MMGYLLTRIPCERSLFKLTFVLLLTATLPNWAFANNPDPLVHDGLKVQNCTATAANGIYMPYETSPGQLAMFRDRPIYRYTASGVTYSIYDRNDTVQWVLDKTAVEDNGDGTVSKVTTLGETHPSLSGWNNGCRVFAETLRIDAVDYPTATGFYQRTSGNGGFPVYTLAGTTWKIYYHTGGTQWVLDSDGLNNSNFSGVVLRAQKTVKNPLKATWPAGFFIEPAAEYHRRNLQDDEEPWALSLASWNMNNYGQSKGEVDGLVDYYASIITRYDIVFIQEIAEPSPPNEYWSRLCQRVQVLSPAFVCRAPGAKAGQAGAYKQSALFYHPLPRGKALTVTNYGDSAVTGFTRQPLLATFTYATGDTTAFGFSAYSLHASLNDVSGELGSLQTNVIGQTADAVALGDFNADCTYLSPAQELLLFDTWNWWIQRGQKTNVQGLTNCAYDRIITRGAPSEKHLSHHILTQGITFNPRIPFANNRTDPTAGVSMKTISDHFLVAIEFGGGSDTPAKRPIQVKVEEAGVKKAKMDFTVSDAGPVVETAAVLQPSSMATLHVVNAASDRFFPGNAVMNLASISALTKTITINSDGSVPAISLPSFDRANPGLYRLVLDMDNNGVYDRNAGDIANLDDQADYIVLSTRDSIDDVFSMDDRGIRRERFNISAAKNVYALAHHLGREGPVDVYLISQQKLEAAGIRRWDQSIASLSSYAIKVRGALKQTLTATASQSFFDSIWPMPSDLFTRLPDNPSSISAVEEYGKNFNIVVDVDRNGRFDPAIDKVDTHTIPDIANWATQQMSLPVSQRKSLRESSTSHPLAVEEYKSFLNAKLGRTLDATSGVYDTETARASLEYLCSPDLPPEMFSVLDAGARIGFQVLGSDEYYEGKQFSTNNYRYADVELNNSTVLQNQTVCAFADHTITLRGVTMKPNATAHFGSSGQVKVEGTVTGCNGVQLVAGIGEEVLAAGAEFIAGALTVFSSGSAGAVAAGLGSGGMVIGQDGITRIVGSGCI